ncbi:copper resistance protein [Aspergillus pseudoviridinutans]|uniref:Crh-like protein n=1 Tax=Aspergillus pseudoviridinutans TaxID=1517512 RepID=A0A9P3B2P7_9EURO|nr:copper resistance protein [Aspergillus pseudoviridinutans]GIJ83427.1 copper resistance protein [Aspergillus pseudoviridinutans]
MYFKYYAAALTAVLPLCSAQTWSKCNPLEKTCPSNKGLAASSYTADFTSNVPVGPQGAEFTVAKKGDSPTIDTSFYFFFGKAEVVMKAAPGTGIVSSIVLESDDLDEIDWEVLGGDTTQVQTNYFGKGDTTTYDRGTFVSVATPQNTFYTYTINWTKDAITWSINGAVVRTLAYNDAKGGTRFPQTPMRLRLGTWAGGDPSNAQGTIQWAGGVTDYSKGPYTMYVKSIHIENANPAESYTYSDNSGSWQSIKFDGAVDPSASSSVTSTTSTSSATSSHSTSTTTLATTSTSATQSTSTPTGTSSSSNSSSGSSTGSGSTTTGSTTTGSTTGGSGSGTSSSGSGHSSGSGSSSSAGASATTILSHGAAGSIKGSYTASALVFGAVAAVLAF